MVFSLQSNVLISIKMKHLIKILILLFAVTLVTGKSMPNEWGLVRDNDKGAWGPFLESPDN